MKLRQIAGFLNEMELAGQLDLQELNGFLEPPLFISRSSSPLYGPANIQPLRPAVLVPPAVNTSQDDNHSTASIAQRRRRSLTPKESNHVKKLQKSDGSSATTRSSTHSSQQPTSETLNQSREEGEQQAVSSEQPTEDDHGNPERRMDMGDTIPDGQTPASNHDMCSAATKEWEIVNGNVCSPVEEARETNGFLSANEAIQDPRKQKLAMAGRAFMSKWAKKTRAIGDWDKLTRHAYITVDKSYEPYEELDDMMSRVWEIGRARVQVQFRKSVHAWIHDHSTGTQDIKIPQHLRSVPGLDDPTVLQDLYVSLEMADQKTRLEGAARLVARWALAQFVDRYEATVEAVKLAAARGKIQLVAGQTTRTQAKSYILQTMYVTEEDISKKRVRFDNLRKKANLWYLLVQHYHNSGILAMIPEEQTENSLRYQSRWPALLDILDLLRPDFHGPRLRFYSHIIDQIGHGLIPSRIALEQLESWTSPARAALKFMDHERPPVAESGPEFALYSSKDDEAFVKSLPDLDRENLIVERCAKFQQAKQDNSLMASFKSGESLIRPASEDKDLGE
ncbi:MAG: hypothetical protein Q9188_005579, partial [Gyalolechia gomerana]